MAWPIEDLASEVPELDAAVGRLPGIDTFCTSSAWALSAHEALMGPRSLFSYRGEHGWVLLARRRHHAGWASLEPLEAAWFLGSSLVPSGDASALAREFAELCGAEAPRDVLVLSGVVPGSALEGALLVALAPAYDLDVARVPPTRRFRADLRGGLDGFLARRSSSLRAGLRTASRKASRAGIRFERPTLESDADALALYHRLLAVEETSWKGKGGDGLAVPEMAEFYRRMLPRLARERSVRAHVATHEGRDVAVILGGVVDTPEGKTYRGLQFSFDDGYRAYSLGNLAQLTQVTALAEEGVAHYDLGSEVDYKRRWGEDSLETLTIVGIPRALRRALDPRA